MNDLYIEWETGHMNIHMDFFFPCNIQRFKKLLKIIKSFKLCYKQKMFRLVITEGEKKS